MITEAQVIIDKFLNPQRHLSRVSNYYQDTKSKIINLTMQLLNHAQFMRNPLSNPVSAE